jgi:hypothetical protein
VRLRPQHPIQGGLWPSSGGEASQFGCGPCYVCRDVEGTPHHYENPTTAGRSQYRHRALFCPCTGGVRRTARSCDRPAGRSGKSNALSGHW